MPISTGAAAAVAAILLILGLGVGYYVGTERPFSSTSSGLTISTESSTNMVCNATYPISLTGASWQNKSAGTQEPGLVSLSWRSCVGQEIRFDVGPSPVLVSLLAYGKTSIYRGYIYNYESGNSTPAVFDAPADGTTISSLPAYVYFAYGPNAVVQWVSGNATAFDPGTGQAISLTASFNVTG